jgi:hypothetical protein
MKTGAATAAPAEPSIQIALNSRPPWRHFRFMFSAETPDPASLFYVGFHARPGAIPDADPDQPGRGCQLPTAPARRACTLDEARNPLAALTPRCVRTGTAGTPCPAARDLPDDERRLDPAQGLRARKRKNPEPPVIGAGKGR